MKILIYTYANHQMGMGHVFRMSILASLLKKRGHDIWFLLPDWAEGRTKISRDGWNLTLLPTAEFENEQYYRDTLHGETFDCILVDALNVPENIMNLFRERTTLLISFDNSGEGRFFADILINILYKRSPVLPSPKQEINDYSHLIMSNEFSEVHQKKKNIPETIQKILITQGGSDTYGVIPQLIDALNSIDPDIECYVFIGPAFRHHENLELSVKRSPLKIHIVQNISDPWNLFHDMDLAICSGGMTLFELLCVGVPTITTSQEIKEFETIQNLLQYNVLINLGFFSETKKEELSSLISNINSDYAGRLILSTNSKKIFDGKGCERIANLIEKSYLMVKSP